MTEQPDHHERLRALMEEMQPVLEQFAVALDAYEGLVSQAKQRGWDDQQARALVLRMMGAQP